MNASQRRAELRKLMLEHKVTMNQVAEILGRSYGTIKNWRSELDDKYAPPLNEVRLLKFELEARKAKSTTEKTQ